MRPPLFSLLTMLVLPHQAVSQSYDNLARVEVLPGWRTDTNDHVAALQITLKPGWITYWRAPGDAGIPPHMTFTGSREIESVTPLWPTPQVLGDYGMISIGYMNGVTVPLSIDLSPDAGVAEIAGEITIGVCEEICIPVTVAFESLLPLDGNPDAAITAALASQPVGAAEAGVQDVTCQVSPSQDGLQLNAAIAMTGLNGGEHVVIETQDPSIWVSEAVVTQHGNTLSAKVDLMHPSGEPFGLQRDGIRITVIGEGRAIDIQGCRAG
ncbi:protein-disulfide reductase DsbD domain-containing protein [Yoonia litorea]|uniref:Thiol-disulfide interchange protein, contains DsbC and DsbD domains n=1 Tax=Yoonia litorea TaxID=1123755 RepID=A0A1I6L3B3_9RHOB|nr:protein-disulfide reductase DsbD domain-containing protein [Yoonia litorea]SFR97961.1 Thiol-disulfide interchange protein, contains DsbC and DsbD domains [Yoonia litorea]